MRASYIVLTVLSTIALILPLHSSRGQSSAQMLIKPFGDIKWEMIVPELGDQSPEIAFLHVDPQTKATHLMIRVPKNFHVPRHWHSANETHTVSAEPSSWITMGIGLNWDQAHSTTFRKRWFTRLGLSPMKGRCCSSQLTPHGT